MMLTRKLFEYGNGGVCCPYVISKVFISRYFENRDGLNYP
jgi:hypothetical protein